MASIAELRATLVSAYTSGGHVAAEQELYEDLMAHKPVLLKLFNLGPSNPQEQKQLESGMFPTSPLHWCLSQPHPSQVKSQYAVDQQLSMRILPIKPLSSPKNSMYLNFT